MSAANQAYQLTLPTKASVVILGDNLFEVPVDQLGEVEVIGTMLEGEPVYDPSGLLEY